MDTTVTVEELLHEESLIGVRIEEAASREDTQEWIKLSMRRDALPSMIDGLRAQPIREEIGRLEAELEALEQERLRVLNEEHEVPDAMRGSVTAVMVKNRKLSGIASRSARVGKELDLRQTELENLTRKAAVRRHEKQLDRLESAGPRPGL